MVLELEFTRPTKKNRLPRLAWDINCSTFRSILKLSKLNINFLENMTGFFRSQRLSTVFIYIYRKRRNPPTLVFAREQFGKNPNRSSGGEKEKARPAICINTRGGPDLVILFILPLHATANRFLSLEVAVVLKSTVYTGQLANWARPIDWSIWRFWHWRASSCQACYHELSVPFYLGVHKCCVCLLPLTITFQLLYWIIYYSGILVPSICISYFL